MENKQLHKPFIVSKYRKLKTKLKKLNTDYVIIWLLLLFMKKCQEIFYSRKSVSEVHMKKITDVILEKVNPMFWIMIMTRF